MSQYFTPQYGRLDPLLERTLLFVGLLPPRLARRQTLPEADELKKLLVKYWQELDGRAWPWRLREGCARLIRSGEDAHLLGAATDELMARARDDWGMHGRGLRVEVNIPNQWDPFQLYAALIGAGAHSAFLRNKNEGELSWSWPLRIGVAEGSGLLAGVTTNSPLQPLFHAFNYERGPMRANLLLCDPSLAEVSHTLSNIPRPPQTDALIVLGGKGDTDISTGRFLSLSKLTGAQGIFIFDSLKPELAQNVAEGLIANLSHNLPIDSAIARLAWEYEANVLSWATRSMAEASSVRKQGQILAQRLQEMGDAGVRVPVDASPETEGGLGRVWRGVVFPKRGRFATMRRTTAKQLGKALEQSLRVPDRIALDQKTGTKPLSFERESDGAKKLAMLAMATTTESDADAARREARHLQARIETPGGRVIKDQARLLSSHEYMARVFIGSRDPEWHGLNEPFQAPEPAHASPVLLDVLFWEPQSSPKPLIAQLSLPPHGNTGIVEFPFRTSENQTIFSARIAVYHRNRNLQTGLLKAHVGEKAAQVHFTLDATPLPRFIGLVDRASAGASIIVNDDPSGTMQAFVYSDGQASVAPVNIDPSRYQSLADLTAALGRAITRITKDPDAYNDLTNEENRKLLLELAQRGGALMLILRNHSHLGNRLDKVDYIQIVSAHVDAFFPIEYLYDGRIPGDQAKVCGGSAAASEAVKFGKCCGAYDGKPLTICPLRFWSMSKVIERHAHLPEHADLEGKFQLRSNAVSARNRFLDPLNCAVLAASKFADTADKDAVTNLHAKLDETLRTRPVPLATDWTSWTDSIAKTHPNLLVLLPHHEQTGGYDLLEIGGDVCKSMLIGPEHVRTEDSDARPIVLLMGCQTNSAKIALEGFIPYFQAAGAAIIVSTIATVLGRHASPAAVAIVNELKKQEGNVNATFGDVMLAVRRELLATGKPMVLGLTSYGDADWLIRSPTSMVT